MVLCDEASAQERRVSDSESKAKVEAEHVCMCVCGVCECACACVCAYLCGYLCVCLLHTHTHTHVCVCVCVCGYASVGLLSYVCVCLPVSVRLCVCVCARARMLVCMRACVRDATPIVEASPPVAAERIRHSRGVRQRRAKFHNVMGTVSIARPVFFIFICLSDARVCNTKLHNEVGTVSIARPATKIQTTIRPANKNPYQNPLGYWYCVCVPALHNAW
jgi:hypothetical protein